MDMLWTTFDGREMKFDELDHQHLSNIYYFTHFTARSTYTCLFRHMIQDSIDDRFDGVVLPYNPDLRFGQEINCLRRKGWLKPNGDIVANMGGKEMHIGSIIPKND